MLYEKNGNNIGTFNIGDKINLSQEIEVIEFIPETGLQIKSDPGIPLIYFGFGLLLISVFLSYRSFSQIWLHQKNKNILIGGQTNRAQLNFEKEILEIILSIKNNIKYGRRDLNSHNKNY